MLIYTRALFPMYEGSREREVLGLDGVQANTRALFSM
jgi:hypothetical protein